MFGAEQSRDETKEGKWRKKRWNYWTIDADVQATATGQNGLSFNRLTHLAMENERK